MELAQNSHMDRRHRSVVALQWYVMSDSLWPHRLQHARLPCPSLSPQSLFKLMSIESVMHPTISSSVAPFSSCPQSSQHRSESPVINPHTYSQSGDLRQEAGTYIKDKIAFQIAVLEDLNSHTSMSWETLTPHTKINSKWLKYNTIHHKLLEKNNIFSDINRSNVFLSSFFQGNWNKSKTKQIGPQQTYHILHSNGNHK